MRFAESLSKILLFLTLAGMRNAQTAVPSAKDARELTAKLESATWDSVGKGIEWMKSRLGVPRSKLDKLSKEARDKAFSLARNFGEVTLERVKDSLARALARGDNVDQWVNETYHGIVGDDGFAAAHAETIFRTETQNAQQAGLREELEDPAYQEWIVGYEYITMDDDRVRENHAAMHGVVFRSGDPEKDRWWPPNGFNCRCQMLPIDRLEAKRGIEFTDPLPAVDPDPGFDKPPGGP